MVYNADVWVVKLSFLGAIQWQKCLGGWNAECANSVQQTSDGGYLLTGAASSNDGDVIGIHCQRDPISGLCLGEYSWEHYSEDFWIINLASDGAVRWMKCLGGSGSEWAQSIQQTSDGGYIVTGVTDSNDGDVSGNHGGGDIWVVKLDQNPPPQEAKSCNSRARHIQHSR